MDTYLADTDFLIALFKEDDSNHEKAVKMFAMIGDQASILLTPYTIPEGATALSRKFGAGPAHHFLKNVRSSFPNEVFLTFDIVLTTDYEFLRISRKATSWFDCLNLVIAHHYNIKGILSFDTFYKKSGLLVS